LKEEILKEKIEENNSEDDNLIELKENLEIIYKKLEK
jgi:hypothetical protein